MYTQKSTNKTKHKRERERESVIKVSLLSTSTVKPSRELAAAAILPLDIPIDTEWKCRSYKLRQDSPQHFFQENS